MGQLVEVFTPLHKKTSRKYIDRMIDDKVHCMEIARQYGQGRIVSCLEGGYNLSSLGRSVAAHVKALAEL